MRQHPIPQNVLDVEFKLFTKFTLKEFGYLAVGVVIGGLFLYLTVGGDLPGIIGIPMFVTFAGAGSFLALVPINDQDADVFITNYFNAINKPTQRVWLNEAMKEQRTKPQVVNIQDPKDTKKVIGSSDVPTTKTHIFEENPGDDILETASQQQRHSEIPKQESHISEMEEQQLTISEENISRYQFPIKSLDKLPGNINLWLCNKENQPIPNVNVYLKDNQGKILYANKTGPNGYFLTNKYYAPGIYNIEFENIPSFEKGIRLVLTANISKLPMKIQTR